MTRSVDVFFDVRLNRQLGKQWKRWWFETLLRPLWHHCNDPHRTIPTRILQPRQFYEQFINNTALYFSMHCWQYDATRTYEWKINKIKWAHFEHIECEANGRHLQATFSIEFVCMNVGVYRLTFDWILLLGVQLTISQHYFVYFTDAEYSDESYLNDGIHCGSIYSTLGLDVQRTNQNKFPYCITQNGKYTFCLWSDKANDYM